MDIQEIDANGVSFASFPSVLICENRNHGQDLSLDLLIASYELFLIESYPLCCKFGIDPIQKPTRVGL